MSKICINGFVCLEYIKNTPYYIAKNGRRIPLVISLDSNPASLYQHFLRLADLDEIVIPTEERIMIQESLTKYVNMKLMVSDVINDILKEKSKLKLYILIREDIHVGHAINCASHAAAAAAKAWDGDEIFEEWRKHSFKKVTCKVSRGTFEESKKYEDYIVIKEDVLNDTEVAIIFKPRKEWPEIFKKARLYS